jgi:glycine/D-amino acid oxidase-like deaminating enzyme
VADREGIDCGFAKAGALYLATNEAQLGRLRARQAAYARYGLGDSFEELDPRATTAIVNARGIHGGLFTPHAAALHPARLARGLAVAVERLGATVYEQTRAIAIEPRRIRTERGTVRAEVVVRATEAYTSTLEGGDRTMLAIGNYMIATEPLGESVWDEIGLARRELFEDTTMLLGYAQRTADGRIAIGGLGAPYWYGSRIPPSPMADRRNAERLRALLVTRFPVLRDVKVTHHWGGVLGIPRDFRPSVGLDRDTGMAWAGGYGGSGVASSNLAGRSLADVITGTDSELARLPWVGHRSRPWEAEPLRWLGVNAVKLAARVRDLRDTRRT